MVATTTLVTLAALAGLTLFAHTVMFWVKRWFLLVRSEDNRYRKLLEEQTEALGTLGEALDEILLTLNPFSGPYQEEQSVGSVVVEPPPNRFWFSIEGLILGVGLLLLSALLILLTASAVVDPELNRSLLLMLAGESAGGRGAGVLAGHSAGLGWPIIALITFLRGLIFLCIGYPPVAWLLRAGTDHVLTDADTETIVIAAVKDVTGHRLVELRVSVGDQVKIVADVTAAKSELNAFHQRIVAGVVSRMREKGAYRPVRVELRMVGNDGPVVEASRPAEIRLLRDHDIVTMAGSSAALHPRATVRFKQLKPVAALLEKFKQIAAAREEGFQRWGVVGIILFVLVPFPGTTELAAALAGLFMGMRTRTILISAIVGGAVASIVISLFGDLFLRGFRVLGTSFGIGEAYGELLGALLLLVTLVLLVLFSWWRKGQRNRDEEE